MTTLAKRHTARLAALALGLGGVLVAIPSPSQAAPGTCTAPTDSITVFDFNDLHGRIYDDSAAGAEAQLAARLFTPVAQARATGEEVILLSSGDNIGASTFVSMVQDDLPTLKILNAAGLDVSVVGNHEFDQGWDDLKGRVAGASDFPYLGANVYAKGTTEVPAPLKEYEIVERAGVRIGIVGAVTADVPSLVLPTGIAALDFGDPVAAVNRVAGKLLDGDPANGEADIVIASFHEGAGSQDLTPEQNAAASDGFRGILEDVDERVAAIFTAHTHQLYDWTTADSRPIIQAGSYASHLAALTLEIDATGKGVCSTSVEMIDAPSAADPADGVAGSPDASLPAIANIVRIAEEANSLAAEIGQAPVGETSEAISTPDGAAGIRDVESPMTNMVAQMFKDVLGGDDPDFIGMQNPGGTRSSFPKGTVTLRDAALALPFANSLFRTELTGAQVKTVLEQQWQRAADGSVPSRPFLQLGLSDNIGYTYDESLPEGSRITSVTVNGAPIDPAKTYGVGGASFLITGGDNFHEFANGAHTRDTGLSDLESWVDWVDAQGALSPDYTKRGVSVPGVPAALAVGDSVEVTLGKASEGGVATQSLDMHLEGDHPALSPQQPQTAVQAFVGDVRVGVGEVVDGVATVNLQVSAEVPTGAQALRFVVNPSGTEVLVPVVVTGQGPAPYPTPTPEPPSTPDPKPTPDKTPHPDTPKPGLPSTGN